MTIDPTQPIDDQAQKWVLLAAVDPTTQRPHPLTVDPVTGELIVKAALTGASVTIDAGDLRIGGVEIQDETTAIRAKVLVSAGATNAGLIVHDEATQTSFNTVLEGVTATDELRVNVKSAPTFPEAGATAYRGVAVDSSGTFLGTQANPTIDKLPSPAKVNGVHQFVLTTAEVLGASVPTKNGVVIVQALSTNPDTVYVGYTGVTVANGIELVAGQSIDVPADNLNEVFGIDGVGGSVNEVRYIVK